MRTGEPLLVYHGTTGGSFAVFDRIDDQTGPALAMVTSGSFAVFDRIDDPSVN